MIALIQRVAEARVEVADEIIGRIGVGVLALIGVQPGDGETQVQRTVERLLGYRIFADVDGKMNLSLAQTRGGLLLVSQFTLAADTRQGMRPGFSTAAPPADGERWFNRLVEVAKSRHTPVETGRFGAHMKVHLVNDGPVTFWLETR